MVVLSEQYATDGHLVFHKANSIEKASPKSFILNPKFPNSFAKDTISKTHCYGNEILNLDYRSVIVHSKYYVSDKNTVLYNDSDNYDELYMRADVKFKK